MKAYRLLPLGILVLMLVACSAMNSKIKPDEIGALKKIVIVPMVSPPFDVDAFISQSSLFGETLRTSGALVMIPDSATQEIGLIGVLTASILMLATLPESRQYSAEMEKSANEVIRSQNIWKPSLVIAALLENILKADAAFDVHVEKEELKYPELGDPAARSAWDRAYAMGKWYAEQTTTTDLARYWSQGADGVVMVGITGYGLNYPGYLWVGVHLKVIESETGRVLAKARNSEHGNHKRIANWLADDARCLKEEIAVVGRPLVERCLQASGLVLKKEEIEDRTDWDRYSAR
jgi:hypothetical protein